MMMEVFRRRFSDSPQRDAILRTLSLALASSTAESYGRHFARFIAFCDAQLDRPSPLPATTDTVLRWLAGDVCVGGKVKEGSLQPYLSAINRIHRDLAFDEPAVGHLVQSYRSGLGHEQNAEGRDAERVYLPPPVVEQVLSWALQLELDGASRQSQLEFRAAVATVFTYVFFARGATGSALLAKHVTRGPAGERLVALAHEKGKAKHARSRRLVFPAGAIPGVDALLAKWEEFRGDVADDDSYYTLPFESVAALMRRGKYARVQFASDQIDAWLQLILARLGVSPPAGEKWTGHSLRKGAASGAAAVGVVLDRICHMGGWSIQSKVVHHYIDPTCPSTPAAYRFFGWLLPAAMRA